tara:strand:+ start:89 stop:388 length:300 start_codon:yes stop_codon:yes gene_type:complete
MVKDDYEFSNKKREFVEFLEKASNQNSVSSHAQVKEEIQDDIKQVIHLNSLITKNISLFTKNPNYKLLAWLLVQLTILSLFILAATILKNNFVPYINSL